MICFVQCVLIEVSAIKANPRELSSSYKFKLVRRNRSRFKSVAYQTYNKERILSNCSIKRPQICMQKIVTMQMYVGWPNCTEIKPSFFVSQKAVAADCMAAPLFYWMMHVTTYLNSFWSFAKSLMQPSMICWDHWLTFSRWYSIVSEPMTVFTAFSAMAWTCSELNSPSSSSGYIFKFHLKY